MLTLQHQNFKNQRVIIRVDFNVPLNDSQEVTDLTRIEAANPTIQHIISQGGSCILLSHLGRPKGNDPKLSLSHILKSVSSVLGLAVDFCSTTIGEEAEAATKALKPGGVLLMENLRYHKEEMSGDITFSKNLSKLGTFYVNDAFGTAHRAHASTTIVADFFPGEKSCGYLIKSEMENI